MIKIFNDNPHGFQTRATTPAPVMLASEYQALASLPGIEHAKVWEPAPATLYVWERESA